MDKLFQSYTGDEPYVFVCYSHDDSEIVYPEMEWLHTQGVNLWYDEGIPAGKNWRAAIGESLLGASHVLFYISKHSLQSEHCNREINLALDEDMEVVPIYLEDVELTSDLKVGLSRVHALHRDHDGSYKQHLLNALGQVTPTVESHGIRKTEDTAHRGSFAISKGSYFVGALLLAVIGFMAVLQFGVPDQSIVEESTTPIDDMSIAVLVLKNQSPDPDNAYFAAGIHEEILNQLSKISALTVKSRTTVLSYEDSDLTAVEIARELNVSTIMEGSVHFADDQVRINLQLINATRDAHMWSEAYQFEFKDIFAIQSDVAIQVAKAMQAVLLPDEIANIQRLPTDNTEAYSLFLEARYQDRVNGMPAPASVDDNILRLNRAIELDQLFAQGIAELGWFKYWKGFYSQDETTNALYDEALDYANQAIEIDPIVERAYSVLARVNYDRHQFDEWERYALRSVELPDLDGTSAREYAFGLAWKGRYEEAWKWIDVAISKDPSNNSYWATAVWHRIHGGDYETALELAEYILATGGSEYVYHSTLAYALNRLGRQAESRVHLNEISREQMLAIISGHFHAYLLCQQGEQGSIMADLEQLIGVNKELKMVYCAAGAGDLDGMFASYQRAMNVGASLPYNDLITDEIRADSRWPALLDYMDLRDPD